MIELLNKIIRKFPRAEIEAMSFAPEYFVFVVGHRTYLCMFHKKLGRYIVRDHPSCTESSYSKWVEGVINGWKRDDAGNMVPDISGHGEDEKCTKFQAVSSDPDISGHWIDASGTLWPPIPAPPAPPVS